MKRKLAAIGAALALAGGAVFGTAAIAAAEDDVPPVDTAVVEVVPEVVTDPVIEETPEVVKEVPTLKKINAAAVADVPAPVVTVGVFGDVQPWTAATNAASYWTDLGIHPDAICYKHSANDAGNSTNDHGSSNGKTVTLNAYGADWPGDHWELLIIKGGSVSNNVIVHPEAGVAYASPLNSSGNQANVSHWIVCKGTTPEPEPEVAKADYGYTPATCTTGQTVVIDNANLTNATWTEESLAKNGTVGPAEFDIEATLNEGAEWAEGQAGTFHVTLLGPDDTTCPEIAVCEAATVEPTSTNVNPQGWTLVGGEWVDGGVEFTASNWSDAYAVKDVNFPLSEANNLTLDFTGGNVWAIILETTAGNVHYEPEPYTDDLWTNSAGILPANAGGQGGPFSGNLDDILSDPTVTKVYLYFTSGSAEPESGVLHSGGFDCLNQPFDHENNVLPIPALFDAAPLPPLCGVAGSFDFSGVFPNVTVTVTPEYTGPGEYLLEATAAEGYEFSDGTTYKSRVITVLSALPFQSEDPSADCYLAPPVVPVGQTVVDVCGTSNDSVTAPADTESIDYTLTNTNVLYAEAKEGFEIAEPGPNDEYTLFEGIATFDAPVLTDEECPENELAFTGNETWPLFVGGAAGLLILGSIGVWSARMKRKQQIAE